MISPWVNLFSEGLEGNRNRHVWYSKTKEGERERESVCVCRAGAAAALTEALTT